MPKETVAADELWTKNGGIYLGFGVQPTQKTAEQSILEEAWDVSGGEMHRYPNPDKPENPGNRHILTIGPNGSGKTRRLLMPNLFRLTDWSIVVVDIKGELAAATAAYRASQEGHRVAVIDPFGVMEKTYPRLVEKYPFLVSNGYNPIAALDPVSDEFPDDALALAEALIRVEGQEPHWSQSAQDLLAALIMYVRIEKPKTGSFADVRSVLGLAEADFRDLIKEAIATGTKAACEEIAVKAERFTRLTSDNKELNSILSTALTQTRWLDSRPMKIDMAAGSFDFGSLKQNATTVYLILPPRYLATHSTWLRTLVTSALGPLLRSTEDSNVPVLFMLDEFAQMGHMPAIENNIALMRGYGVKLWPVFQDLAQAKSIYKTRWESFVGNAGAIQSFAPQDMTTREYLSRLSGQRLYWFKTGSTSFSKSLGPQPSINIGTSEAVQHMPGPEYWPQGLGKMDQGEAVLFTRGRGFRAYLPDPEDENDLLGYRDHLRKARAEIGGNNS